ncbi:MAG: hypothetical protein JWN37_728 [Candidatus Nomurabacteria bacterium]|nr:hypothetical protein [Candidatus Nomurabacteria bacterium]
MIFNKKGALGLGAGVLFAMSMFVGAISVSASTIYVDKAVAGSVHDGTSQLTAFATIQEGIDAAISGDVVNVYPGAYDETASNRTVDGASYQFGLFFGTSNVTVQGVDASGNVISNPNDIQATITTNATNSFGPSGVFVAADGITLSGFTFGNNASGLNKTIEVIADNFTLKNSKLIDTDPAGAALYISDFTPNSLVNKYTITNNIFADGATISLASGAGSSTPVTDRNITNNVFTGTNNDYGRISFSGNGGQPWYVYPVGGAVITGNTFTEANKWNIRARGGYDNTQFDWKSYWDTNTFAASVVSLSDESTFTLRDYSYGAYSNVRSISSNLDWSIENASSSDVVKVGAGTYNESLLINKPLLITGAGTSTIITGNNSKNYIIEINGTKGVTLNNLYINGGGSAEGANSFDYGVLVNDSGTSGSPVELKNLTVKNIWNPASNDVEVDSTTIGGSYALIHDNNISSFDKRGIRFINSSGKIYSNDVLGDNVDGTSRVQNLVNLWGGSDVEIYGNTLHNALTTGATPTWASPAIFISSFGGSGDSTANIHDNEIYASDTGIVLGSYYATTDNSSTTITSNNFHDLNQAIALEKGTVSATITNNIFGSNITEGVASDDGNGGPITNASINAARNWWGNISGPTNTTKNPRGNGASVYDEVTFSPWYTTKDMIAIRYNNGTTTSSITTTTSTSSSAIANNNGTNVAVTMELAIGTTITGTSSWDGTFTFPTATTTGFTINAFPNTILTIQAAVELGLAGNALSLDIPLKLTFAGLSGSKVAWSRGGVITDINATCTSTSTPTLAADEDCRTSSGSDLIVWTRHLTTFVAYTQVAFSSGGGGGGGSSVSSGGGGGGSSSGFSTGSVGTPQGQVLGAATTTLSTGATSTPNMTITIPVSASTTYSFTKNMMLGSRGIEVTNLQAFLITGGYLKLDAPTGYFGGLTRAAVAKWQKAMKLPNTGYFGAMSRAMIKATYGN